MWHDMITRPGAGVMPEGDLPNQYTRSVDIFAYGLLVLELVSKRKLDVNRNTSWQVGVPWGQGRPAGAPHVYLCLSGYLATRLLGVVARHAGLIALLALQPSKGRVMWGSPAGSLCGSQQLGVRSPL
jgi:hypothetical protein